MKNLTEQLDHIYGQISKLGDNVVKEYGQKAMDVIADYPLYVSGTDNITYETAIIIALAVVGDIDEYLKQEQEFEKELK